MRTFNHSVTVTRSAELTRGASRAITKLFGVKYE